jgi:ergothioneine biosynthesis protein EgtB
MIYEKLLEELRALQNETISIVSAIDEQNFHQQFHPDLSPIGWHLGHCVYTESYWIREQLLGEKTTSESLKSLYVPELSNKESRGSALPNKTDLLDWAKQTQSENCVRLESAIINKTEHHLLENNYLLYFLIQHYSQHIETMCMVLTEMQLSQFNGVINNYKKLIPKKPIPNFVTIETGQYDIGSNKNEYAYDNEQPPHEVSLNSFNISKLPVSNAEYLFFINDGGYSSKTHWSDEGWQWLKTKDYQHPHHWRTRDDSTYYGINHKGAYCLEDNQNVYGLSFYEAQAYAHWCNARLPHEYEWEVAFKKNGLQQSFHVWEWCNNTFHPYKNFSAYPYEGYSAPYFDEKHYVLRGGSDYTKMHIKRGSFRNYYTADKQHIFAGLRLVYN